MLKLSTTAGTPVQSDIRKPYSKELPHLTKVKSLEKQMVDGYNTFNSIVINDLDKQLHLLASTPYSSSDPYYNQIIGVVPKMTSFLVK